MCVYFLNFATRLPMMAASVTPVALAARSSQSPLRRPLVQYSCKSSIIPLITIGASQAKRKSFALSSDWRWLRRYSSQTIEHVPPYITMCTHLSINFTLSSSVLGGVKNERYHIMRKQSTESGYFLAKSNVFFIFTSFWSAKLRNYL